MKAYYLALALAASLAAIAVAAQLQGGHTVKDEKTEAEMEAWFI